MKFSPFFCFVRAISAPQLLHQCGDLRKGVFMWLLDLMSEVVEHQSSNRMSAEAIAIVRLGRTPRQMPDAHAHQTH
eukprot:6211156-Pleurochrysis_carterae.AAC.1